MSDEQHLGLHWGIKSSFLDYVGRTPDGRASLHDGVTATEGNVMVFEPDPEASDVDAGTFAFRGDLRFAAHAGMMFVRIAHPLVKVTDGRGEMTVVEPRDVEGDTRLPLVRFTLEPRPTNEDLRIWLATDVALTVEGVALFNDVYQVDEPFSPLAIFLPAD
ncbi:HtaA domain-containing protein [Aeromicrobium ginsengisoli]|uniref:HtaA domain-containing protein n=1 Tax=Aeromicrobium ginsengisoli TaxID=363867 RepID=UPI00165F92CE|nr:HtaA domain-containing protein [Aeromicrobium ginsengisoli]